MKEITANSFGMPESHKTTLGERVFDIGVYGGVGYVANACLSIAVSHYAKNVPGSKLNSYYQSSQKMFEKGFRSFKRHEGDITRWSTRANDLAFLSSGGWALLVPMKWMEDKKPQIVGAIDHRFNTGPAYDENHPLISDVPQQSYMSLFGGRAMTYPLIITFSLPIITYLGGEQRIAQSLDKAGSTFFNRFTNPEALRKLTATELITALTGTVLLYGSSKSIAYIDHLAGKNTHKPDNSVQQADHLATLSQETSINRA